METLARIDTVAYVRFASVYKNFQAADDFDKFVSELRPDSHSRGSDRRPTLADDQRYMAHALALGRRGMGRSGPTPPSAA